MGIGDIVNYGTIATWAISAIVWTLKRARGQEPMPWPLSRASADHVLAIVIVLGLISSAGQTYFNYTQNHESLLEDVTVSAYPEGTNSSSLQVVREKTFENDSVPLDGYIYDHCTFTNACLMYEGGAYSIQHSTFNKHWRICVRQPPLKNLVDLGLALHQMCPGIKISEKTHIGH
jgi:hypothetical protein